MVIARDNEHTAVGGTAISVTMFECIASTIDTRPFAVPDPEHAIDSLPGVRFDLLRAEHCSCGQVFIDGRKKLNIAFGKKLLRAP
jgi:hypothetical protein